MFGTVNMLNHIVEDVMSGKGSSPRPFSVDQETYDKNWNAIFNNPQERDDALAEEEAFKEVEEKQNKK